MVNGRKGNFVGLNNCLDKPVDERKFESIIEMYLLKNWMSAPDISW